MAAPAPSRRPFDAVGGGHPSSAMPIIGETMAPWLSAAFVLGAVNVTIVVRGHQLEAVEQSLLLLGLCGTLAAAGLVAARSHRELRASMRTERARPAADELVGLPAKSGSVTYLDGMEHWTAAMLELIEHALSATEPATPPHLALKAAATDTRDLHELLCAKSAGGLTINDQAQLHALGSLWETSQPRVELVAAQADPAWHRRWRARSVVARRLCHGATVSAPLALPYGA